MDYISDRKLTTISSKPADQIESALSSLGASLVWGPNENKSNLVYACKYKSQYYIVIRGTNSIRDVITQDLRIHTMVPWKGANISNGMLTAYTSIRSLINIILPGKGIVLGHSLGGALAQMLGLDLGWPFRTTGAFTVGDANFAALVDSSGLSTRYYNTLDPVPYMWDRTNEIRELYGKDFAAGFVFNLFTDKRYKQPKGVEIKGKQVVGMSLAGQAEYQHIYGY